MTQSYSPAAPATVPRTTAVSAIAVFRSPRVDAMFPIKVQVPWENIADITLVSLTFHVPRGFEPEVVLLEPNYVLCSATVVEDETLDPSLEPLATRVEVSLSSEIVFPCSVKFTNCAGTTSATSGPSGEEFRVETYSRCYPR